MKHYSLLRLITLSAILMTAMAFSCQDLHIPEPVTNCNRVDGTPRAFNCEFEFVKAEFYKVFNQSGNTVYYDTATAATPEIVVREGERGMWIRSYVSMFYIVPLNVKVTVKRIAPPPTGSMDYLLRKEFTAGSSGVEFPTTALWAAPTPITPCIILWEVRVIQVVISITD
jgi:hypothetical protein